MSDFKPPAFPASASETATSVAAQGQNESLSSTQEHTRSTTAAHSPTNSFDDTTASSSATPGSHAPAQTPSKPRAPLAITAFSLGATLLALELVANFSQAIILIGRMYAALELFSMMRTVLFALLAVAGVVLGAISLAREPRRGLAGLGTGICAAVLVGIIGGLMYTLVLRLESGF